MVQVGMTNDPNDDPRAVISICGDTGAGKTAFLATGLNVSKRVLQVYARGEGDAASSLQEYPVIRVVLENYDDLMALLAVLHGKGPDWIGDSTDPAVARLTKKFPRETYDAISGIIGDPSDIGVIGFDGIQAIMRDILLGKVIEHIGVDQAEDAWKLYGGLASIISPIIMKAISKPNCKFIVLTSHIDTIEIKSSGGRVLKSWRQFAVEGKKSYDIIDALSNIMAAIVPGEQVFDVGDPLMPDDWLKKGQFWTTTINGKTEKRNRWLTFINWQGVKCKRRGSLEQAGYTLFQADLERIWNKFYAKKSKEAVRDGKS